MPVRKSKTKAIKGHLPKKPTPPKPTDSTGAKPKPRPAPTGWLQDEDIVYENQKYDVL